MNISGLTARRVLLPVICSVLVVTIQWAVAIENTAEEIVKQYVSVDLADIDKLVVELGHPESSHRTAALDKATHLPAQSLAALVAKLKTSDDPELIAAARTLEPALVSAGLSLPMSTVELMKKAVAGDARSQGILALMFANCDGGLASNPSEALRWARTSADQGSAIGQYSLARLYDGGCGVAVDTNKATELFGKCSKGLKKMAEKGDAEAQCDFGWLCEQGKGVRTNREEAVKWYQKSAEQGHARGQFHFGSACTNEVPLSEASSRKAVELYRKAAEQGCADAENLLGESYGNGVRSDDAEAAKWYRKAAELGHAGAQCNLGTAYERGAGVEPNGVEAVKWYTIAAAQGYRAAQLHLAQIYDFGAPGIPKNMVKAMEWYDKVPDEIAPEYQYNLARMYENGTDGVRKDMAKAVEWWTRAGNSGIPYACNGLAWLYATSAQPGLRDGKKAVEWGLKACLNRPDDHDIVDSLAAAYARDGQFDKAVETQAKAIKVFDAEENQGTSTWRAGAEKRLELYKKHEAYVDEDGDGL
jgi:TPR repeat protein